MVMLEVIMGDLLWSNSLVIAFEQIQQELCDAFHTGYPVAYKLLLSILSLCRKQLIKYSMLPSE